MRKLFSKSFLVLLLVTLICGCSKPASTRDKLCGQWYFDNGQPSFLFNNDGSCIIQNEYGTGSWDLVNGNQIRMTNYYGESEIVNLESVTEDRLEVSLGGDKAVFYKDPNKAKETSSSESNSENSSSASNSKSDSPRTGRAFINSDGTIYRIKVRTGAGLSAEDSGERITDGTSVTVYEEVNADGFTWYRIGDDRWIAGNGTSYGVRFD
jgi:hypothetical protein